MIKPIETRYKNYRFRSRLEARWAVFFDALGIQWDYEWQGYDVAGLAYLPDFILPDICAFVEVKPFRANENELKKARDLSTYGYVPVLVVEGDPMYPKAHLYMPSPWRILISTANNSMVEAVEFLQGAERLSPKYFHRSHDIESLDEDTVFMHHQFVLDWKRLGGDGPWVPTWKEPGTINFEVRQAMIRARSARFEHGETPQINR